VSSAPHSGRTAHRVASRPPGRPLRRSVSSPSPKRAPRRRILGLMRPPDPNQARVARLTTEVTYGILDLSAAWSRLS